MFYKLYSAVFTERFGFHCHSKLIKLKTLIVVLDIGFYFSLKNIQIIFHQINKQHFYLSLFM